MRSRVLYGSTVFLLLLTAVAQEQVPVPAPPVFSPSATSKSAPTPPKEKAGHRHSVELKWEPSSTEGIQGYYVYRAEGGANGTYQRITRKPVKKTTFTDTHVTAGETYAYAVSAVQRIGKKEVESERTPPRVVRIP